MNIKKERYQEHTFPDGVKVGDYGDGSFLESMKNIYKKSAEDYECWVSWLREYGVKAAHPDDGWHNREEKYIHFAYPRFDDGVEIGDLIAMGDPENFRIVKIRQIEKTFWKRTPQYFY